MRLKPNLGLALAGGGARGLAHIGVLAALERHRIPVRAIAGTSIGSVVGALYCLEPDAAALRTRFERLIETADLRSIGLELFELKKPGRKFPRFWELVFQYQTLGRTFFKKSIADDKKIRAAFRTVFGGATFRDLKLPFAAVAVDLVSGRETVFSNAGPDPGIPVSDAVYASCALPAVFPPLDWDGKLLVDGGVTDNVPVVETRGLGADVVLAVFLGRPTPAPADDLARGHKILLRSNELANFKLQHLLLAAADLVLRPRVADRHWLDFDRFAEALGEGSGAVEESLAAIKKITGRRFGLKKRLMKWWVNR